VKNEARVAQTPRGFGTGHLIGNPDGILVITRPVKKPDKGKKGRRGKKKKAKAEGGVPSNVKLQKFSFKCAQPTR